MRTAKDAAQFLADQAVEVAELSAQFDDGNRMREATERRAEIMMDCARMIADRIKKEG